MRTINHIFFKLVAGFLLVIVLSYTLTSVLTSTILKRDLRNVAHSRLEEEISNFTSMVELASREGWSRETLMQALDLTSGLPGKNYYVYGADGSLLYTIGRNPQRMEPDAEIVRQALAGNVLQAESDQEGRKRLLAASPIAATGDQEERAVVMMEPGFEREVRRYTNPFFISAILSIWFAVAIVWQLSRRMSKPLKEMNQVALRIAKGDFSRRIEARTRDEIGQLGLTLNYMADELASLERMRREFVTNVSHDLRTPLTSINGFVTALMDGTVPPERHQHYMKIIKSSTSQMLKLVEDLLDIAKIEANQFSVEPRRMNLSEQVRIAAAGMEPQFTQKQMKVALDNPEVDVMVYADPHRIQQVLVNLLQNAVFYSPAGTCVDISVGVGRDDASVSIRDKGIGMKPEELERIWERFYKGDKARSRKVGTGIGLSIVKHILDLHGSRITVESEPGQGTEITFTLPRAEHK